MAEDNVKEVFEALTAEGTEDLDGKLYGKINNGACWLLIIVPFLNQNALEVIDTSLAM